MEPRQRLLAPCAHQDFATKEVTIDTETLLLNLLLFDTYIMQSHGLGEIPRLIELFDYRGLMGLLRSGALKLQPYRAFPLIIDSTQPGLKPGQSQASLVLEENQRTRRPGTFNLTVIRISDPETEIERYLRIVDSLAGLSSNRCDRLTTALNNAIIRQPLEMWDWAADQTHLDLDRSPLPLRSAVARCLRDGSGRPVNDDLVDVKVHRLDQTVVRIDSNLTSRFNLDAQVAHRTVGNALLSLARLDTRLAQMKAHEAISGIQDDERPFWDSKLDFLLNTSFPEKVVETFHDIVSIRQLPEIGKALEVGALDADRFMKIRNSPEAAEFRQWLRTVTPDVAASATDVFADLINKIADLANSKTGRVLRFGTTTGVGLVNPAAGISLGVLDGFILGSLLPRSGPSVFLSHFYPSIFDNGMSTE